MKNFWQNKKVLVTGGAGFIGSHAVEALLKNKAVVTAVVSPKTAQDKIDRNLKPVLDKIKIRKADVTLLSDCIQVSYGHDIILNFAALDGGANFKIRNQAEIFRTNIQIVLNILEAARINKVNRVLLMSSTEIYAEGIKSPIKEDEGFVSDIDERKYGYAWSKRTAEILAKIYYRQYGLKTAIARCGSAYGPRDYFEGDKERIVPAFVNKALKKKNLLILNGSAQKQLLYVTDLVKGLLDLAEKYAVCDPVNLCGEKPVLLKELAKLIIKLTGSKVKVICRTNFEQKKNNIVGVQKARKVIGFKEKTSLKNGLTSLIKTFL